MNINCQAKGGDGARAPTFSIGAQGGIADLEAWDSRLCSFLICLFNVSLLCQHSLTCEFKILWCPWSMFISVEIKDAKRNREDFQQSSSLNTNPPFFTPSQWTIYFIFFIPFADTS